MTKVSFLILFSFFTLSFSLVSPNVVAQNTPAVPDSIQLQSTSQQLNVFIDCKTRGCDFDYFRREMPFLNYVRNRQDADLHILINAQNAGNGARNYTIDIIGLRTLTGKNFEMEFQSSPYSTDDDVRFGLMQRIKTGILPFMVNTEMYKQIDILFRGDLEFVEEQLIDPWNLWVFRISLDGNLEIEQRADGYRLNSEFNASRTSDKWKVELEAEVTIDQENFDVDDETVTDNQRENEFESLVVRSLSEHWSIGGFSSARSSTFNNYDLQFQLMPAIEYNLFPYSESSRKKLTFRYMAGLNLHDYTDVTIYDKSSESLFSHALNISMVINQPWGDIRTRLQGSSFLHDLNKNRIELSSYIDVNLFKGFSLNLRGEYSMIRDQLNLPGGGASRDDILLQRREIATDFEFQFSIGISYTFGSLSNNVVNPRFGF